MLSGGLGWAILLLVAPKQYRDWERDFRGVEIRSSDASLRGTGIGVLILMSFGAAIIFRSIVPDVGLSSRSWLTIIPIACAGGGIAISTIAVAIQVTTGSPENFFGIPGIPAELLRERFGARLLLGGAFAMMSGFLLWSVVTLLLRAG